MQVSPEVERQILARATHINGVPVPPPSVPAAATSPEPEGDPSTWTEAVFQAKVKALAKALGWRPYHTHDSRRSDTGFPDLCLARPPRVVFIELKSAKGTLSGAQKEWAADLRNCPGVEYLAAWPEDWPKVKELLA